MVFEKSKWLVCLAILFGQPTVLAKVWTVDERQDQQMKDINAAQKSGQLTAKQSEVLRKGLANVARKKSKMTVKGGGKLSKKDIAALQSSLDKVSADIKKGKDDSATASATKK